MRLEFILIFKTLLYSFNSLFSQGIIPPFPSIPFPDTTLLIDAVVLDANVGSGLHRTIPGSISLLTGNSIIISDGTNLATAINTLPGVTMQSGTFATNRIVIRGMGSRTPYGSNRIRAYLNDIPLTTSDGLSTPEEIDLQSLSRIEVVKGPASALYGSGLGGSINLFTPAFQTDGVASAYQYGSFNTHKGYLSGTISAHEWSRWVSVSHFQSDGYRENSHYRRSSLLTTSKSQRGGTIVNTTLLVMTVRGGIPSSLGRTLYETNPKAAAPNWLAIRGYKSNIKGLGGITFTNTLNKRLINRLTLFGRWNNGYEKRPFNNLDDQSLSAGIRNRFSYHTLKTDWVLGTEWIAEQYEWQIELNDNHLNQNRENRRHLNTFSFIHFRPTDKLLFSFAGSVNWVTYSLTDLFASDGNQSGSRHFPLIFSPRLGFNYSPSKLWATYASVGHGFSLPSPEETLLPEGDVNTNIKPEQGIQYEAGFRFFPISELISIDASFYWIELRNLLVTERVTEDIFMGINAGRTRHKGAELFLRWAILRGKAFPGSVYTRLSFSQSLNKFIEFTHQGNTFDGNYLPGIPHHSAQLLISWKPIDFLDIDTHLQHLGKQFLDDENTLFVKGYFLASIRVSANIARTSGAEYSFTCGIINITNTHYPSMVLVNAMSFGNAQPRYFYPGLPRHQYVGVKVTF